MGIRKKLLSTFFAIIIALLVSEGFFITTNYIILSKYQTLANNMISEYKLIGNTSYLIEALNQYIKSPIATDNFNAVYFDTKQVLAHLQTVIVDNNSKIVFQGLESNINDILFDIEIGIYNINNGNYLEAISRYDSANHKNTFVRENATNLLLQELEYAKDLQIEIEKIKNLSQIFAFILFLITTFGSIWYATTFSLKLVAPLTNLTNLAKKIEEGDTDAVVSSDLLQGDDEISSLANSFNTMVLSLKSSIKKLQEYNNEIKNAHIQLEAEKEKLQQYLDMAGIFVLIFDADNKVILINKKGAEIIGAKPSEIIGKNWVEEYVTPKNRTQTKSLLTFLANNIALSDTIENSIKTNEGSIKNIVWHFSLIKSDLGSSQVTLATGVDVTELTNAKITIEQLKELDDLKNEVLNIATHELKTPLISIVGLSEVMESQPKTIPQEYKDYISIIHKEGLKLTGLIKTMLTANRNDVGKQALDLETFDLVALVLSLKTPFNMLAKRTNSQVKFNLRVDSVILNSDKIKISQVLYNFIDNAVKYGPENQEIELNLFLTEDDFVKIEVAGAGVGISPEMQKKLFIKFSQLEPSLSRSQDGMGLGLYICKQNIENLGGKIGVVSELNQGATFYFTLPLKSKNKLKK